jgi:hypothetical protein
MLTEQQKQKLREAGYNEAKIASYEQQKSGGSTGGGFMSGVKSAFTQRGQNVAQAKAKVQSGQQNLASGLLQSSGQVAGLVGDVGFEGIKAVTPQPVEDFASGVTKSVMNTKPVRSVMDSYEELKQSNPEAMANLEAVLNIGSMIPGVKAGQLAGKGVLKAGEKTLETAGKVASPITGLAKGASEVATKGLDPENIMQRVARIPKGAQAKFEKTAGESVGKYLNKRDIYGSTEEISDKLYRRFETSKNQVDKSLSSLKGEFQPTQVRTALKELVARERRVSSPGAPSPDFIRTKELVNKFSKQGLTMSEINEVKRLFERNIRLDFVKQNLPEGVARATNIDNAMRNWQFGQAEKLGLKNLPGLNKETRLAKELLDAIGKESAGMAGNNLMTLTDWIILAGGDPTAIGGFLGKKLLSSKKLQSGVAKKLYKGEKTGLPKAEFGTPKPGLEEFMNR